VVQLRASQLVKTNRVNSKYVSFRMNCKGFEALIKIEITSYKKSIPKIKV
jgi:hypothetical protein